MKTTRYVLSCALAILLGHPASGHAEDIDIYSGLSDNTHIPNVLIVMDNAASFSNNATGFGICNLPDASGVLATNSMHDTSGGIEQCALYNVISSLPVNDDGSARVKIGFMVYNATGIHDANYIDAPNPHCSGTEGGCLVYPLTEMTGTAKDSLQKWISTWQVNNSGGSFWIKANGQATAAAMQETWAYYAGKTGISGRDYSNITPASGCQKNFVIFIGNAFDANGTPSDSGGSNVDTELEDAGANAAQRVKITNTVTSSCGGAAYTFPDAAHDTKGFYADEWSRFMNQFDLYSSSGDPSNTQSIVTYTVGLLGENCKPEYAALLQNMADYGGGKYFATTDYASMVSAIMQVLNEIQAVNSVFASSSLPVSVNAQGTYLNQIYMGMFRPDAKGQPRWVGNLKQYSFRFDADNNLYLADSVGRHALDSAGTGFVSANAVSYWTCSRADNPYLNDTTKTTAAELSDLTAQKQICASDPAGGFWANTADIANTAGKTFDLADGELVEKGGAAQQMRLANLTNDYTTAAGTSTNPRKLYTFCPDGVAANCKYDLTHADNAFATTNTAVATAGFGGSSSVNIATLERVGDTVTVTTASNHGFVDTDSPITIANATPSAYNGPQDITRISDTQFSYHITSYPLTPANTGETGVNYQTFVATPKTISTLSRNAGSTTITATTETAHGFTTGDAVVISGASETQYNNPSAVVTVTGANTFTYTVPSIVETPPVSTAAVGTMRQGARGTEVNVSSTNRTLATAAEIASCRTACCSASPCWKVNVTTATNHNLITPSGDNINVYHSGISDSYASKRTVKTTGSAASYYFFYPSLSTDSAVGPTTISNSGTATSVAGTPMPIVSLTNRATAVVTATAPGANYSAYLGTFTVRTAGPASNTFDYTVPTTPATPAAAASGATMTATGGAPDSADLINWVRGHDNNGDETGPTDPISGAPITVRPSLHGDVLHSRPTVLNYGGQRIRITATAPDPADSTKRIATASAEDVAKIGGNGATAEIRFANHQACVVTVVAPTQFRYSASNCGAIGLQDVATTTSSTVVYYGDNGGVFHAVNGNQANPLRSNLPDPGRELWGFIPREMFEKLSRLRTNSPQLELSTTPGGILPAPRPKDYFVDGPIGVYQFVYENGTTQAAYIYLTMRRGGRIIYALDVTEPTTPKLKWKVDNNTLWKVDNSGNVTTVASGLGELGQTWSQPKVARVAHGGAGKWVLIFGAGYAEEEDDEPPVRADTMGRGIFVLDAFTGELVWKATYGASDGCSGSTTQASCTVADMKYSIPADIALLDRDLDLHGYIDRLYATDTGGNIWRVDLEPDGSTPDKWRIYKLAALGCSDGPCSIPPGTRAQRKFFFPPEVIATERYDAVIAGTGDREHPLYEDPDDTRTNRVVLVKDTFVGKNAAGMTAIDDGDLEDKTSADCLSGKGYKYRLARGEKVVNAPLVTAGKVYFGTNKPSAPEANACTSTLGTAQSYPLEPFTCTAPVAIEFAGGGLPPSPVSGIVNIILDDDTIRQAAFLIGGGNQSGEGGGGSALEGQKPTINVPTTRTRTYWYRGGK
ncbi:MAG: type IV pilus assembly protein PilY1 [Gallionellaceae bacterium]|nr:MAG: type IV pilus assembly protein PilY1 [Gallionellaceae bacterium]